MNNVQQAAEENKFGTEWKNKMLLFSKGHLATMLQSALIQLEETKKRITDLEKELLTYKIAENVPKRPNFPY